MDNSPSGVAFHDGHYGGSRGYSIDNPNIKSFIELHVEQGPVLRRRYRPGIVTGIVGQRQVHFTVFGKPNHGGTTYEHEDDAVKRQAVVSINERAGLHGRPTVGGNGHPTVQYRSWSCDFTVQFVIHPLMDYFLELIHEEFGFVRNHRVPKTYRCDSQDLYQGSLNSLDVPYMELPSEPVMTARCSSIALCACCSFPHG